MAATKSRILLGAIADDFTGATDLANVLVRSGMRTVQTIGVPSADTVFPDCDALVIALKSRSIAAEDAITQSLAALQYLQGLGVGQFFFKVCSTFDSTENGNIGPVGDALLAALNTPLALVCPAYPANKRSVFHGHLFVGEQLLSDSPMRNHPLTPMHDANLLRVLAKQSVHSVGLLNWTCLNQGDDTVAARLKNLTDEGKRYVVADAICDADLMRLGLAAKHLRLLIGGAGLALGLARNFQNSGELNSHSCADQLDNPEGPAAILVGSCSEATRGQLAIARDQFPCIEIDPLAADNAATLCEIALAQAKPHLDAGTTVLFYSSAEPEALHAVQEKLGAECAASRLEDCFAMLARALRSRNVHKLIVAGGETSGAVVSGLGVTALRIGPQIDPGVPWTQVLAEQPMLLALKSGNFGRPNFFNHALEMLS